jgi:HEAT repeat protein
MALIVGAFLLLAAGILFLGRTREPKHNGRPLNDWLSQLVTNYPRPDREAVNALNAMGENAVQSLIEMASKGDSPLKKKLLQHSDKLPILEELMTSKLWSQLMAIRALAAMGTNATAAIPTLKTLAEGADEFLSPVAQAALASVENKSPEALALTYFEADRTNSSRAFGILLHLGPLAKQAIPVVLAKLQSTNELVRLGAASLLESIGAESPECIPVFTNLLADADHSMHRAALGGLANCGDIALPAAPAVSRLLEDIDSSCRSSALVYLWQVIPPGSFEPYRLAVRRLTNDTDQTVREWALKVLEEKQPNR